jgi:hypothetical protein
VLKRYMLRRIDAYRARVAPTCHVCQETPERSFSLRVRRVTARYGAVAGLLLLSWGWLAHMGRFERGGW